MAYTPTTVGSIDERGYLKGLTRRGYTPAKCRLELEANVLDAMDRIPFMDESPHRLIYDVRGDSIKMIDNGVGMNNINLEHMFALHRENHTSEESRGVSGIGAKPALSILSQKSDVYLYTHKVNGGYFHAYIPWADIHSSGTYTGKIQVRSMTDAEKEEFMTERAENGMLAGQNIHGTTIKFPVNSTLRQTINDTFTSIGDSDMTNPLDRSQIVYGRENIQMFCKTEEGTLQLPFYNYFGDPNPNSYYTGVSTHTIEQWSNADSTRFIWVKGAERYEIKAEGRGLSKQPHPLRTNMSGFQPVGDYTVKIGLRKDTAYFNTEDPKEPPNTTELYEYDRQFLGEKDEHDYLSQFKLFRNNMLIGLVPPPDIAIGSMRAHADSRLEYMRVQVEISFNPVSLQDNAQDRAMNIQENKNQFDGKTLPKTFTRLVKQMRKEKADEIKAYFNQLIQARIVRNAPAPAPAAAAVLLPESDDESRMSEDYDDQSTEITEDEESSPDESVDTPQQQPSLLQRLFGLSSSQVQKEEEKNEQEVETEVPQDDVRLSSITIHLHSLEDEKYGVALEEFRALCTKYNLPSI
jgi:hypothetical protein